MSRLRPIERALRILRNRLRILIRSIIRTTRIIRTITRSRRMTIIKIISC